MMRSFVFPPTFVTANMLFHVLVHFLSSFGTSGQLYVVTVTFPVHFLFQL